jgi:hypothetical protein
MDSLIAYLYTTTDLTQQQIADRLKISRKKVKNALLRMGIELVRRPHPPHAGGKPVDKSRRDLLFNACARKSMLLLEDVGYPRQFQKVLVACPHHPEGRSILVKSLITAEHCCYSGNAQSPEGRAQRAATLSTMWDDSEKKIPLLRSSCGHPGSETTKLYICRIKTKDGSSVLKFGRSERGAKRYGSFLVESLWETECLTEKARLIEMYAHLKFSEYSLETELETSGYTECYTNELPVQNVIDFFINSNPRGNAL